MSLKTRMPFQFGPSSPSPYTWLITEQCRVDVTPADVLALNTGLPKGESENVVAAFVEQEKPTLCQLPQKSADGASLAVLEVEFPLWR
ncbi:hypothetical protein DUI87_21109 [Hirundo rustica rustica]|uniref:Uncharacterized protein n=1 Tax=Hirundo rustica rustica TaxID=333673 RepID=A0A3M0K4C5_HIRRU|nr:hypothetical protein DUI87_21109 [Hirundo rustica rustica]